MDYDHLLLAGPTHFLQLGIAIWLGLIGVIIAARLLNGKIRVRGMLASGADSTGGAIIPERLLTLSIFSFVLLDYAIKAAGADVTGGTPRMPDVPDMLVSLLAGSNGVYLAGKFMRFR